MSPSAHLVIFDAMNLIRRIYAVHQGQPQAIEKVKQQTTSQMLGLLEQLKATHTVAVFDGLEPGWRHQLWPSYKSSRPPLPEELSASLDGIQQHWQEQGVDSVLPAQDEADDVIATLATKAASHQVRVTIVSTDQGFYQLLTPFIQQYDSFNRRFLTPEHYQTKFKISAGDWPCYKALTGESSSDIPGVTGFGPKTAQEFISHHFEEKILSPSKITAWKEQHNDFKLFCQLMTLACDRPLGFKLSDIRWIPCH